MKQEQSQCKGLIPLTSLDRLTQAMEFCASIQEITVRNDEEQQNAGKVISDLKLHIKTLDAEKKEITREWAEKKKYVDSEFKVVMDSLSNAVQKIDRAMSAYQLEVRRKLEEEQKKREAEAAERRRKEEEAARKELEKAEAYRQQDREEMAQKAEARAEARIDTAVNTVAPVVEERKPVGTSFVESYRVSSFNLDECIPFMLSQPMLKQYLSIDAKGLEKLKKAAPTLEIPGIKFVQQLSTRSRAA